MSRLLPKVVTQHVVDLVIGNGENVAGGFGITPELAQELFEMGLSVITTGNHAWDRKEILDFIRQEPRLLRPANYPSGVPGQGSIVVETPAGERLAVLQLMGRASCRLWIVLPGGPARSGAAQGRDSRHHRGHACGGDIGEDGHGPFPGRGSVSGGRHSHPCSDRR